MREVHDAGVRRQAEDDLESVYREHGQRIWRAGWAFSGDPDVADEAVAEAFAQALARGEAIRRPLGWIWRVAFRVAAGRLKARSRWASTTTDAPYDSPEPASDLVAALKRVSPSERAALVLHHYAGYPVKEVASIIGSTPASVRVHLNRGRRRLRKFLEEEDG